MLIVADENIPLLDAFFEGFGEIRRVPGRSIDRATVEQADVLLVRSASATPSISARVSKLPNT